LIREDLVSEAYPKEILSLVVLELWHREFIDGDHFSSRRVEENSTLVSKAIEDGARTPAR